MRKFFCPAGDPYCPYYGEEGTCTMTRLGLNPLLECDDAGALIGDDDEDTAEEEDAPL